MGSVHAGDARRIVVDVAARALRAIGYTVLQASDGAAALDKLADARVDVLVTDVVMPGMGGRELAEAARALLPELKVVYMSGYTDDEILRRGVSHGAAHLIEKPFRIHALAGMLRVVLDRP